MIESQKESYSYISQLEFLANSLQSHLEEIKKRHLFSNYLLDPNKFRSRKFVRIIVIVIKYVRLLKNLVRTKNAESTRRRVICNNATDVHPNIILTDDEISTAERYFWKKDSAEVQHFIKIEQYKQSPKTSADVHGTYSSNRNASHNTSGTVFRP